MENLPQPKQEASITDARGVVREALVQAIQNGTAILRFDGYPTAPVNDMTLDLQWGTPGGAHKVPVRYLTGMEAGGITVWVVEPAGEETKTQRREYVRVEMGTPLEIRPVTSSKGMACILADVSEVGLRGQISNDLAWMLRPGAEVSTIFQLGPSMFDMFGEITRVIGNHSGRTADFVVKFDQNEQDQSLLRRSVFAEQVRQRNLLADIRG